MSECHLCFLGQLVHLLSAPHTSGVVPYALNRKASIKDIIEAVGPPHTEIERILVNSREVDFSFIPRPGQVIGVHPFTPPADPCRPTLLRPDPLPGIRFLVDVNVGKLARLLRMLGIDAAFDPAWKDADLASIAAREARIVLSRDHGLLKRSCIQWGRLIRADSPLEQLVEVLTFFGLKPPFALFTRCLACNTELQPVSKAEIEDRLEPKTRRYYQRFRLCPGCQRIYWRGSHHQRMLGWVQKIMPRLTP